MKARKVNESEDFSNLETSWDRKNEIAADADKYNQLCVWPGTQLGDHSSEEFESFILTELGARVRFIEEVITLPGNGGEGGRNDLFFYVHDDDIGKFAVPRLSYGIKWWEDVVGNNQHRIYPKEIIQKYPKTW